jgi:uncharacterized protein YaiE (UPF0345 family)
LITTVRSHRLGPGFDIALPFLVFLPHFNNHIVYELKKYHGDKVMSLTYEDQASSFSVGVIAPGEYQFGSIRKEVFTVTHGEISAWHEDSNIWQTFGVNEQFTIPDHKNFKLKVESVSAYICHYE